jgi:hypothetical protein
MIKLQERDFQILNDIGKCGMMSYSQLRHLHFISDKTGYRRINKLKNEDLIQSSVPLGINEKIFVLSKYGNAVLSEYDDIEYKESEQCQIIHKLMRSQCYCNIKKRNIENWQIESIIKHESKEYLFDASFEHNNKLYLLEVHNEQKTKVLKQKLVDCLQFKFKFNLIIYCKNKDVVKNALEKMNEKGFDSIRRYGLTVYKYGEEIEL